MPEVIAQPPVRFSSFFLQEQDIHTQIEEKAKKIFILDSKGCVIFRVPRELLTVRQLALVYFLAHIAGYEHNMKDTRSMKGEELGKLTGAPAYALSALESSPACCFVEVEEIEEEEEEAETAEISADDDLQPDTNAQTSNEPPLSESQPPSHGRFHNFLQALHLVKAELEEEEVEKKSPKKIKIYTISLTMVNIVLDEILATVAAWERKHFYPFKWQDRQINTPYP
ncbi:MAG: hypothetical protein H6658_10505 [Ardenticatenaceae bacterium]|nr:hypothetical protein [Ardenticatenaceae bacterium]